MLIASLNLPLIHWLWVGLGNRNQSACSKLNLVQSSRSQSTTCPRKGRLLRFGWNSPTWQLMAAMAARKCLEMMSDIVLNWSQLKSAAKLVANEMRYLKATSLGFRTKDFLRNLLPKIVIYCVTDQPSILWSRKSVPNFKLSILGFWGRWVSQWAWSKNCGKWKKFNSNLCPMR